MEKPGGEPGEKPMEKPGGEPGKAPGGASGGIWARGVPGGMMGAPAQADSPSRDGNFRSPYAIAALERIARSKEGTPNNVVGRRNEERFGGCATFEATRVTS